MKLITAEVVDTGEKKDGRGRRLIRARERATMIAAYEQSGLTQRAFAEREGVKYATFTAWLLRYRRSSGTAARPTFAEVRVPPPPAWMIEIALPNGIVIRANGVAGIAEAVSALRSC